MIYVFLANGFEEVEALTPVDYLRRCELEVCTIGIGGKLVRGSHGITVMADGTLEDVDREKMEAMILPGGMPGTLNLESCPEVQKLLDFCTEKGILIGAICAAPSILGHKGLLEGKRAVCFPGFESELKGAEVRAEAVVTDGAVITSKGAGTANEFAFALAEKLLSKERADKLAASVQWKK